MYITAIAQNSALGQVTYRSSQVVISHSVYFMQPRFAKLQVIMILRRSSCT